MSLAFRLMYRVGFTPWEHADPAPALVHLLETLPAGRMLDIGCGTGGDAVRCAARGWKVTGVDASPVALRKARARAAEAGVDVDFVQADVTRYEPPPGCDLILDGGCLHGLAPDDLRAVSARITAATAPGATLLMFAFSPGRRGPLLPRGLAATDLATVFPEWTVAESRPADDVELSGPARSAAPHWHRLVRT